MMQRPRKALAAPSAAERVLPVVDGVAELLQHDVQRGVLRQLDHEHARLHADVPGVRGTCGEEAPGGVGLAAALHLVPKAPVPPAKKDGNKTTAARVGWTLNMATLRRGASGWCRSDRPIVIRARDKHRSKAPAVSRGQ